MGCSIGIIPSTQQSMGVLLTCLWSYSVRTLQEYMIPNVNEPDGVMLPNIEYEQDVFTQKNPGATNLNWRRHVILAFDSMIVKGRFVVNFHTNEIVGVTADIFSRDVLLKELRDMEAHHNLSKQNEHKNEGRAKHERESSFTRGFIETHCETTKEVKN